MNTIKTFKLTAKHPRTSTTHIFLQEAYNRHTAGLLFTAEHPNLIIKDIDLVEDSTNCLKCIRSPNKMRNYYKTRLCQIRGNLQSMTDSEDELLTCEEVVQIQRLTARIDRIISLFHTRTMDLKNEGKL